MSMLFVRFAGIVACFCTSWKLGLVSVLPILLVHRSRFGKKKGPGFNFETSGPRYIAEFFTLGVGLYGIAIFPYTAPQTSMIAATLAALLVLAYYGDLYSRQRVQRQRVF